MKSELKKELLKMLRSDMMEESKSSKGDLLKDLMPKKGEKMSKVTVMGDSPKAVMAGLSKAEQIMKAKLGTSMEEESEEESEEMCPMCEKEPCECEESEE